GCRDLPYDIVTQSVWGSTDPWVTGANQELVIRFKRGVEKRRSVISDKLRTLTPPPHILRVKVAPLAIELAAYTLPLRRAANHKPRNLRSSQPALAGLQPIFPAVSTYYFVGLQLKPPPFVRWRMRYLRASCCRCCYCSSLLLTRPRSCTRGQGLPCRSCRHRLRTSRHQKRVL